MSEIDTIRLSQTSKDHLIKLKRLTGIENWNILCRWALMASLAEKDPPAPVGMPADSNVEMSWKVFAGEYQEPILAILKMRMRNYRPLFKDEDLNLFLRLNLYRGIAHLTAMKGTPREFIKCKGELK